MNNEKELLVLEAINNSRSLMPLFKTGYSYSDVLVTCKECERRGYIEWDDEIRTLTKMGLERLKQLKETEKIRGVIIKPLDNFKIDKMRIDEVFLP